jgi:tight adherence protein B
MAPVIAVLLALGCFGGLVLAGDGLCTRTRGSRPSPAWTLDRETRLRLAAAALAAAAVQVLVGWPVAALLVGVAVVRLPALLGGRKDAHRGEARIEAVGTWAEMLRDTLDAAAGLEQAILASAVAPPPAIAAEVTALAADLSRRIRLPAALDRFGAALADPVADLVVAQLTLAATCQAGRLAAALTDLAGMAREHVAIRLDIESDRAAIRTQIRMIVVTTVLLATGLEVFRRPFLRPYDTPTGQLVLVIIGVGGVAAFTMLGRLSRFAQPPRVLAHPPQGPS